MKQSVRAGCQICISFHLTCQVMKDAAVEPGFFFRLSQAVDPEVKDDAV